jgi:enoyl-CoA hydratase
VTDQMAPNVRGAIDDGVGRIVLDRPRALNALDLTMVTRMGQILDGWRGETLRAVTVESSTAGIFCAGGDIRRIRQNTLDELSDDSDAFFATEYRLNAALADYPVPVVALIDGVCMGGGLGISVHGRFRVVTERALLAMPETGIGFFPDVGASFFLPRLPGGVGTYLALTGARLAPADALAVGLATHHVHTERLAELVEALSTSSGPVDAVIREFSTAPEPRSEVWANRAAIDRVFHASGIDEIRRRLDRETGAWADDTRVALARVSPQSLQLALDLMLWGAQRTLHECLAAERAAARWVVRSPDFIEGVRAGLVDKDRSPLWGPSQYAGMDAAGTVRWVQG